MTQTSQLLIHRRRQLPKPGPVFDSYWHFAYRRQAVFQRRLRARPPPWTDDPILQKYKFTNAFRASDRTSQYLIRSVIYDRPRSPENTFFRILLFKLFNRIETWQLLEHHTGDINVSRFAWDRCEAILGKQLEGGKRIYSGAYIMPSGGRGKKHQFHLQLLRQMKTDKLPERLLTCSSMHRAYDVLLAYGGIGPFLAYQLATDLNYSPHLEFSEMEFVMPGPGARDGIKKCFLHHGDYSEADIIAWVADTQEEWFTRHELPPCTLWGRPLQLIDCQNLFCEVDKYARMAHPQVKGLSGRTRIKQQFVPSPKPVEAWYPPKWGINDQISA